MNTLWRWLRYGMAIFAGCLLGGVVWISWLLSGQHYQTILAEQLSALLGARVRMENSHLSLHGGLGLRFDSVTVQEEGAPAPFFAAEGVEFLLDFAALWRGEMIFHRIDFEKPLLQVKIFGERFFEFLHQLREAKIARAASESWFPLDFTPTLAVKELRLHNAEFSYKRTEKGATLLFLRTEIALAFPTESAPTVALRTTLANKNGEIGQVTLHATATQTIESDAFLQSEWTGKLECSDMQLQQVGQVFDERWPPMRFGLEGKFQGKREGPIDFTGVINASDLQLGAVQLSEARLQVPKARWEGGMADSWLHSLVLEAKILQLQGGLGKDLSALTVSEGALKLREGDLTLTHLRGSYGNATQFTDASVSLLKILARDGPKLEARITADLDLTDDLPRLLTALTPADEIEFLHMLSQPGGRAQARFRVRRAQARSAPVYDGSVTLQHASAKLLPWKLDLKDLNGEVRLEANVLSFDALTFSIGQAELKARGRVQDFLSPRRDTDLRLAFRAVRDYDIEPFLPPGKVLPQGGFLNGDLRIVFSSLTAQPKFEFEGHAHLSKIRLDLLDFLHPFEVVEGELKFNADEGTFSIKHGQLPGGAFSGHGRIESWEPLRLELSGNLPHLDLDAALVFDKPEDGLPKDATREIKAELTSGRLTYKGAQVDDLRLVCHWHGRQADWRITHAHVAGGNIQGEGILWPDAGAAYLAPQLDKLDVEQFFRTVGVATNALSGSLSGEGKIYMPQWTRWSNLAQWQASLSLAVENGVAQRLPILVRLWSVLSMQGLLRLQLPTFPTEGLPFSLLSGDFLLGEGVALTNNLSLTNNAVRFDARGQIDLAHRALDLKTAFIPLHGLTSSVAKVPLAGEILARGADYLTTMNFHVSGPYHDPSVTPLLIDTGGR